MSIDLTKSVTSLLAAIEGFDPALARADRARLLANIRSELQKLRAADEQFYEAVAKSAAKTPEAEKAAIALRRSEADAIEMLRPRILSLQRFLTDSRWSDDPEAYELLRKAVNVTVGYMVGYQNVRGHLTTAGEEALHARPTKGKVDHEALSREFMARFPKIRAALAK